MTLALLLTAASGAWADSVTMKEITSSDIQSSWNGNTDPVKATDLPGFKAMTHDEAVALGAPSNDEFVFLIYAINANNKFAALIYMSGTKSSSETEFNLNELQSTAQNYWVYYTYSDAPTEPTIEVTTNAEEGATFTEATFDMPAYDATADYELVRDMSIQMQAQVGTDPEAQPRYRVKKDGNNKFIPADMEITAVPALFTVIDGIENNKVLTQTQDYIVQIYPVDAEGQPTGEAMTFATFTFEPGIYAVKAVAAQGSDYDGETALSNTFKLFQGYEIEVAAGEYATFFKDEALYVEDEDAQLYTITDVNGDKATATELTTAPAYTPLLVKNTSEETKTILLIPTTDRTPDDVTKYVGFVGTTIPTEIAASDDIFNRYAFNGLQFVWVKNVIAIAANKCWLEVPVEGGWNALALRIVFGNEATGIGSVLNRSAADEWYDLSGRKLTRKPTVKGVYILNGRKVVVK